MIESVIESVVEALVESVIESVIEAVLNRALSESLSPRRLPIDSISPMKMRQPFGLEMATLNRHLTRRSDSPCHLVIRSEADRMRASWLISPANAMASIVRRCPRISASVLSAVAFSRTRTHDVPSVRQQIQ